MLESLKGPDDLRGLTPEQLNELSEEIRQFLITKVSKTGGHLGPNLGVVELTIALHRTFDSPKDVILYDTGHQSYVHKIITGRADQFDGLRQRGGIAGYPNRRESEHDVIENSHASTALSWGDGISRGFSITGQSDRSVVVVVGDGALTGGMSWEALNNIASAKDRNLVLVVNDNERSYSPTIGGLASHLATLRMTQGYERFLDWGKEVLQKTPVVGAPIFETLHGMKKGIKDIIAPQGMFEDLGLKYIGPIDGHDIEAMEKALLRAKAFGAPVILHAITEKGRGYAPAIEDEAEKFHAVGVIDPESGEPLAKSGTSWTKVFAQELVEIGTSFDKNQQGQWDLGLEGGHSQHRILHHKDSSGLEIEKKLLNIITELPNIQLFENYQVIDLNTETKENEISCTGAFFYDKNTNKIKYIRAR